MRSEVKVSTQVYARVDMSNPIAIWEEEFGWNKQLSHFFGFNKEIVLEMDNYRPQDRRMRPVVILIHGGAFLPFDIWSRKDKSITTLAFELAQRGYSVFSIDYRKMNVLAPSFVKGGYIAAQDAKAALRFIANHSDPLFVQSDNIFVGGISAGAITSLNAVFLDDEDDILGKSPKLNRMYGCLDCVGESAQKNASINGVINIAGGVYDPDQIKNNSNIPILSFHGENDDIVPMYCGLPFERVSGNYNAFMDNLKRICSGYPKMIRLLEEAKVSEICGSGELDNELQLMKRTSRLHKIKNADHYLLMSTNNTLTVEGQKILNEISDFLYYWSNR